MGISKTRFMQQKANNVTENSNIGPQTNGGPDNMTGGYNPMVEGMLTQDEIQALLSQETNPADQNDQQPKEGENMKKVITQAEYDKKVKSYMTVNKVDFFTADEAVSERYVVEEQEEAGKDNPQDSSKEALTIEDELTILEGGPAEEVGESGETPPLESDLTMTYKNFKYVYARMIGKVAAKNDLDAAKLIAITDCPRPLAGQCMVNLLEDLTENNWANPRELIENADNYYAADTVLGARVLLLSWRYKTALCDTYEILDWPEETRKDLKYSTWYCDSDDTAEEVFRYYIAHNPDTDFDELVCAFWDETIFLVDVATLCTTDVRLREIYEEVKHPAEEVVEVENVEGLEDLLGAILPEEDIVVEESTTEEGSGVSDNATEENGANGDVAESHEGENENEDEDEDDDDDNPKKKRKGLRIAICVILGLAILVVIGVFAVRAINKAAEKHTTPEEAGTTDIEQAATNINLVVQPTEDATTAQDPANDQEAASGTGEADGANETAANETAITAQIEPLATAEATETAETEPAADETQSEEGFRPEFIPAKPGSVFDLSPECYGPITGSNGTYLCEVTVTREQAQAMYDDIVNHGWTEDALRFFAFPDGMMAKHSVTLEELTPIINGEATSFTTPLVESLSNDGTRHTYADDVDYYYVSKVLTKDKAMELIQQCEQEGLSEINIDPSHPVEVVPGLVVKDFILTTDYMQNQINLMNAVGADRCCIQFRASK